jgi:hypothetical protein
MVAARHCLLNLTGSEFMGVCFVVLVPRGPAMRTMSRCGPELIQWLIQGPEAKERETEESGPAKGSTIMKISLVWHYQAEY